MYVQYQIPMNGDQHVPVVMVHGCCLSSKTWETTPDGRIGWSEYFVRKDRSGVSRRPGLARAIGIRSDRVQRGRVGQAPRRQDAEHPERDASSRRGPCSASARSTARSFPDEQFPMQAVDEFYKQMIPDLNSTLGPAPRRDVEADGRARREAERRDPDGPLRVGLLPRAGGADRSDRHQGQHLDRDAVRHELHRAQLATLAKIPTLVMFGDHLGDVHRRSGQLGAVVRELQHVRRAAEESRRRRRDDAPAGAWASKATATC